MGYNVFKHLATQYLEDGQCIISFVQQDGCCTCEGEFILLNSAALLSPIHYMYVAPPSHSDYKRKKMSSNVSKYF